MQLPGGGRRSAGKAVDFFFLSRGKSATGRWLTGREEPAEAGGWERVSTLSAPLALGF